MPKVTVITRKVRSSGWRLEPAHPQRWGLGVGGLAERVSSAGRSLRLIPLNKFSRMAWRGWSCRHARQRSPCSSGSGKRPENHDRELRKSCGCALVFLGLPALGLQEPRRASLAFHPHFTWLPGVLQGCDPADSGSNVQHLGLF